MLASIFVVLLVAPAGQGWDASSLVVSLRHADRAVDKAALGLDTFKSAPERRRTDTDESFARRLDAWQHTVDLRLGVVETLRNLALFTENQWVNLTPTVVTAGPDGTLEIRAKATPRNRPPRQLVSDAELELQKQWKEKRRILDEEYKESLRANLFGLHDSVVRDHTRKLRIFKASRGRALRPITDAIRAREEAYRTVTLSLQSAPGFADAVRMDKLTSARKAKVMFRVTEIELSPPRPDARVPAVVGRIVGTLLAVEDRYTQADADDPD